MPATRKGIYHNLRESKYTVSNSEVVYFFSSKFYLNKFLAEHHDHRKKIRTRFNNLIPNHPFNTDMIADVSLYTQIEKRGFFVRIKGAKVTYDDLFNYAVYRMKQKDSLEWYIGGVK